MKKQDKPPITLVISVVAMLLAAYATFNVIDMKAGQSDEDFKADVYKAIDDYVAEKSGQPTGPVDVSVDDDPAKGDENAPVTIIEFTDYQCPFCKKFATETLPQIMKNYVDTGKVRYVLRDFPLGNHPDAGPAANAAECVRAQGGDDMYFDYHDTLFVNQNALGVDKLKEYAAGLNIDQGQLASCIDNNEYVDEIKADFDAGGSYGVRGTPAFYINGNLVAGAQPYENFVRIIDEALEEAE